VAAGAITAVMGFWVTLKGDRHTLSAQDAEGVTLPAEARTAVIMPICNEDVTTVFAGLRATCESLTASGAQRLFDVFVLSDTNRPEVPSCAPGRRCASNWPPGAATSACTTAGASCAPAARPATWPTSAAAGAVTTATWW
jgi:hypothetical protein